MRDRGLIQAEKKAPTGSGLFIGVEKGRLRLVGARLLAMDVNDNAYFWTGALSLKSSRAGSLLQA
jgi:hypothetical protein